jgi:hypothetical protein
MEREIGPRGHGPRPLKHFGYKRPLLLFFKQLSEEIKDGVGRGHCRRSLSDPNSGWRLLGLADICGVKAN